MDTGAVVAPARRRSLATDLVLLGIVGALLVAATVAAGAAIYREFYSPAAFVQRYLGLLADGRAADALALPGVAVSDEGLPDSASDAFLRRAALGSLDDVRIVSESDAGDTISVTAEYTAGGAPGRTSFIVVRDGGLGPIPTWRFARTPLAALQIDVQGATEFSVNGFTVDERQLADSSQATDAPAALVFSPGVYRIAIDTPIARSDGVAVLADAPGVATPVQVVADPTEEFVSVVQQRVDEFLAQCATQQVLQPTGCPFGFTVQNRVDTPPQWSIASSPVVSVEASGAGWRIPATEAVARLSVRIRSLFDGSVRQVDEDVPFAFAGEITIQPDGAAAISVSAIDR